MFVIVKMKLSEDVAYHPTLRLLLNRWLEQDSKYAQRALNFMLYTAVLHKDERLTSYCLCRGADLNAKPEKWYCRFLGNLKGNLK